MQFQTEVEETDSNSEVLSETERDQKDLTVMKEFCLEADWTQEEQEKEGFLEDPLNKESLSVASL